MGPCLPTQTPEQLAAELERERIETANMEHDADPGEPPSSAAFASAVVANLFGQEEPCT